MKRAWRAAMLATALTAGVLMAAYSALTPAFEAPDEPGHFRYVELLAGGHGLPIQGQGGDYDPEFSQPPLYYALEALLAGAISPAGAVVPPFERQNPAQNRTATGNVNLYSHPAGEAFPWRGQILQLHAMRLANLLLAAMTLLATYGIAREVGLGPWLGLAAAAVLGLLPQLDFIAGALNADNAVTAAAALTLWLLLRWLRRPSPGAAALVGLAAGAAMLSKLSGAGALLLALAAMAWQAARRREPRLAAGAALAGAVSLAAAGWWYARNLALYGDALGWQPMLTAIGAMRRPQPQGAVAAAAALFQERATAIGVFGWNNLRLPAGVYLAADVVAAVALVGWMRRFWGLRQAPRPHLSLDSGRGSFLLLILWVAVFAGGLVRWIEVNTDAAQWRLLFPAFPALAVLLLAGLEGLLGRAVALLPVGMAGLSAASLLLVLRPAYTPEPAYAGPIQHQLHALFGDRLELVGADDPAPRTPLPGQPVEVTLYWRAVQPLERDDLVDLAALDVSGQQGLKESTWPQQGRAPTSGWIAGQVTRDRHVLGSTEGLQPGVYSLQLDVFEPLPGAPRLPLATGGTTLEVAHFLIPPPAAAASPAPEAKFGDSLALLGHNQSVADGRLEVTLAWTVIRPVAIDYTIFVHVLDDMGKVVAQDDSQPAGGRFPTSLLPVGTRVDDRHTMSVQNLTPDTYTVEVGIYDAVTGARLKTAAGEGALSWPLRL
ncbi:MAG TPA: glycosyltransferase family 39 protein [Chloroflexota bacterium]